MKTTVPVHSHFSPLIIGTACSPNQLESLYGSPVCNCHIDDFPFNRLEVLEDLVLLGIEGTAEQLKLT